MRRKIIHIDCDCYYAALEMRDFPHLKGQPIAVGGTGPRSVLSTCNYEARAFGIHSAMPVQRAINLCPHLIIQPHRFDVYRVTSDQIHNIFKRYSDRIEPLSLDEAFLDVSESQWFAGSATLLAEHIRCEIFQETGITVSAGVAPNKFLAKVGSDWNKPNGLYVIAPNNVDAFVADLSVKKINGVGKKFYERLKGLGIETCSDLQQWNLPTLIQLFGKSGLWLYQISRGIDNREVGLPRQRKSLSVEHTFAIDLCEQNECVREVSLLFETLQRRMANKTLPPVKGIFVKVRFSDFSTMTMERTWALEASNYQRLVQALCQNERKGIRLVGLGVRFADQHADAQLGLWPEEGVCGADTP